MPTIATPSAPLTELAGILARGYLRLTSIAPDSATSGRKEPPIWLDSPRQESPPVIETGAPHGNNVAP